MFKYLVLFLITFYLGLFYLGFYQVIGETSYPILRDRLGTILSHSSDVYSGSVNADHHDHLYCYYPSSQAVYRNKGGEFILLRVASIEDCRDFFGITIFNEGSWVSEREKIWWSKSNKLEDELVKRKFEQELI